MRAALMRAIYGPSFIGLRIGALGANQRELRSAAVKDRGSFLCGASVEEGARKLAQTRRAR